MEGGDTAALSATVRNGDAVLVGFNSCSSIVKLRHRRRFLSEFMREVAPVEIKYETRIQYFGGQSKIQSLN